LHAIREGLLQDYVIKAGGAEKVLHFGSKVTPKMEIHISFQKGIHQYSITLERTAADQLHCSSEAVYFRDKRDKKLREEPLSARGAEAGISNPKCKQSADFVRRKLDEWRLYHFHDTSSNSPLRTTADVADNEYLRPDGANLAAFLYYLHKKHETSYSLIRRTVQLVVPFLDDFRLKPQKSNPSKIRLEWRHIGSEGYFDVASLSDGALRFIALATLFLQPEAGLPSLLLVDEPELGLHPLAITLLASLVKQASHKTQVIVSTQSPILLDHFRPEDVLVAERVDGGTQLTRLESAPLATWLEDYSLGQLWEKNEIGGRPKPEKANGQTVRSR
jgi:hypothetical protein